MYISSGNNNFGRGQGQVLEGHEHEDVPAPTYEKISTLSGDPLRRRDDGSMRLSLNQLIPLLTKYSTRCFALTPRVTFVFKHIPSIDNITKPRGYMGLFYSHSKLFTSSIKCPPQKRYIPSPATLSGATLDLLKSCQSTEPT